MREWRSEGILVVLVPSTHNNFINETTNTFAAYTKTYTHIHTLWTLNQHFNAFLIYTIIIVLTLIWCCNYMLQTNWKSDAVFLFSVQANIAVDFYVILIYLRNIWSIKCCAKNLIVEAMQSIDLRMQFHLATFCVKIWAIKCSAITQIQQKIGLSHLEFCDWNQIQVRIFKSFQSIFLLHI